MKIVGLITEYNPFHNGHQYHIEKALEVTNADVAIVVMSGDFVQRGKPAIMSKYLRTKCALKAGVALVLELPVCYATGSAEYFSYGAVSILHKLGCVDAICFGSECGDIEVLQDLAKIIHDEPAEYKEALNLYLRQGNSFPLARQKAVSDYFGTDKYDAILSEPNNILGIEYLKALYRLNSPIKPYTIRREFAQYHEQKLNDNVSSATAIRAALESDSTFAMIARTVPSYCHEDLYEQYEERYPIIANDFSLLFKYKLLSETKESLQTYADVSEELANRIINNVNRFITFEHFCYEIKTKEITYSRICRALLHILIGIRNEDYTEIGYARVLGFRNSLRKVMTLMKQTSEIPLLTRLSARENLSESAKRMLDLDIYAANLYESVASCKFKSAFKNELEQSIVKRTS